jgi:hypothetical protein
VKRLKKQTDRERKEGLSMVSSKANKTQEKEPSILEALKMLHAQFLRETGQKPQETRLKENEKKD